MLLCFAHFRCDVDPRRAERRLRRLVAYMQGHVDDCLLLVGVRGDKVRIVVEEDADFAGDKSRRSTTGFLIKLVGPLGTYVLLDWKSSLQKNISLSTAEAEIVAFRDALRRVAAPPKSVRIVGLRRKRIRLTIQR